jgi:hypothetical protein
MQDVVAIAALLREVSFGILIAGLFYTFGMFALSRIFGAISEHGDVDHDMDHDIGHEVEHDIDHDVGHGYDIDHGVVEHDLDHDLDHDVDHGEIDHEIEHDLDHDVDHDVDHHVEHDHDIDVDHDIPDDKSGFFETERGAPMGVTIGTSLVTFGFLGSLLYYDGIMLPFLGKITIHILGAAAMVYGVRLILRKAFVESGFMLEPRHIVGREVEAVSTISDGFGEVRLETEMGLRRFRARPFQKGVIFQRGTNLFIVSADDKFVYVDPRKDVTKWIQEQSKKQREESKSKK